MISIETLLNPGGSELTYRVSRNGATLLGRSEDEFKEIFSEIKELYKKRSQIIHTGKSKFVKKEDVLKLRHYFRESIKKIYRMNMDKNEIIELLNSSGFGKNRYPNIAALEMMFWAYGDLEKEEIK